MGTNAENRYIVLFAIMLVFFCHRISQLFNSRKNQWFLLHRILGWFFQAKHLVTWSMKLVLLYYLYCLVWAGLSLKPLLIMFQ